MESKIDERESATAEVETGIITLTLRTMRNQLQPFAETVQLVVQYFFWFLIVAIPTFFLSCFIYYFFYWMLIPQASFTYPVNLDFTLDPPSDTFFLTRKKWQTCLGEDPSTNVPPLRHGEIYDVSLSLDVPMTPRYRSIETTPMIKITLKSCEGEILGQSARGLVPRYYNAWSHTLYELIILIPSAFGFWKESTEMHINLMREFEEAPGDLKTCLVEISISESSLHIYEAKLEFSLLLSGFRRIIRDYFFASSFIGIYTVFMVLMAVLVPAAYVVSTSEEKAAVAGGVEPVDDIDQNDDAPKEDEDADS